MTDLSHSPTIELGAFERYLAGQPTDADRVHVDRWLIADPRRVQMVQTLKARLEVWDKSGTAPPIDVAHEWRRLQPRVDLMRKRTGHGGAAAAPGQRFVRDARWGYRIRNAAYAVVASVALVFGYQVLTRHSVASRGAEMASRGSLHRTAFGERATVSLGDGTQVSLAPGTTLQVVGTTVALSGHAVFHVTHKPATPFVVTARGTSTRVLGTTFSVHAYPDDPDVRIAVRDGRVAVQSAGARSSVVLGAEEVATVAGNGQARITREPVSADFAVTDGQLVLREMRVPDAMRALTRWYGVEFSVRGAALQSQQLTTTARSSLTNGQVQDIADALGARVERSASGVVFIGR